MRNIYINIVLATIILTTNARKHLLQILDDGREYFPISTFGFYRNGYLQVDVSKFKIEPDLHNEPFGFSLEKISNRFTDQNPDHCQLKYMKKDDALVQHIFFLFDTQKKVVTLNCSKEMENMHIGKSMKDFDLKELQQKEYSKELLDTTLFGQKNKRSVSKSKENRNKRAVISDEPNDGTLNKSSVPILPSPINPTAVAPGIINEPGLKCSRTLPMSEKNSLYNFSFAVYVAQKEEEGLYLLNFHNCLNYGYNKSKISMDLSVIEKNPDDNYLSAGEMPLPALYFMMSLLFFLSACFWFFLLKKSNDPVFKIHYLMGLVVVIKSLSLLFHGTNYHFIQTEGVHMEAWAVMYYIMHLLKGALLFTVLALIGSGWAFIKHVLSSKEKKIFMVVIPLQIIANVATIIKEETEESNAEHRAWVQLLYLIDFLCCVAILLPVVWSIRHLQDASQTDGKAAVNLRKLKLFRHFYIMIVCYIYFTRIIVSLLQITVPYQYEWLYEMFKEMATYVFFVMTGYKFRPANNNPYFLVDTDDEEEIEEVITTTGLTEGITHLKRKTQNDSSQDLLQVEVYEDHDEVNLLTPVAKESSHDYD